jgi:hypothetical protein
MTIIHHDFGGASALPPSPEDGYVRFVVSDGHSSGSPNCAREVADRAHQWIEDAMMLRHGLTPQERRERAHALIAEAEAYPEDHHSPLSMGVVGRKTWTAYILIAED